MDYGGIPTFVGSLSVIEADSQIAVVTSVFHADAANETILNRVGFIVRTVLSPSRSNEDGLIGNHAFHTVKWFGSESVIDVQRCEKNLCVCIDDEPRGNRQVPVFNTVVCRQIKSE